MNPFLAPGRLTSGRRTYQGNRLVGGVPNSHHLDGSAGDYVETTPDALRAFFGSGAQIIPESDHLHVQGLPPGTFPYFGHQGIAGLTNGVDTTQGQAPQMAAPRKKPASLADLNQPAPVSLDAPPIQPQASSLADLTGNTPQLKQPSKFNFGNLAGILGDALMAYGGMQPQFGPRMAQQQDEERQMGFDREKLNAELQMKREEALAKAQEPPQFAQNAQWFAAQPKPVQNMILQSMDQTNPIFTATPQGTTVNRRYNGPPPEAVTELRAAASKGDHAAIDEFEQVFGPGSARAYLAQ